jgi:hypothetical protein
MGPLQGVPGNRGEQDDLYIHALAGSVISCGKAAMEVWFSRRGPDLSPASLAELRQLLIDAMALLGAGFNGPRLQSTQPSPASATPPDSRSS